MDRFIRAREELYGYLYQKYMADDGPYCGDREFEGLCETNRHLKRAALFAEDMGHIKYNRFGGMRLTAAGVPYAETIEQFFLENCSGGRVKADARDEMKLKTALFS